MAYTGEQKREYQRKWLSARRSKGIEILGSQCVSCGSTEDLEFDHIEPEEKEAYISRIWSRTWTVINLELAKCQLLCSGCHLTKTLAMYPERKHGTHLMYTRGACRCTDCKKAHAIVNSKYR